MRLLRWVLFWFLAPAAALALDLRPAETPPDDFAGRQYIDSRGCVFLRSDSGGWDPRQSRDGQPVCGYPPTLSQRGLDGRPRLRALDPDAGKSRAQLVEEALTRAVIPNLRAGELSSDPRPVETLPDMGPEPHDTAPMDALRGALRAAPAVRAQMSRDLQPNRRLCALLGYDKPGAATDAATGSDPTKGYCGNLPDSDLSRLTFARPIGTALQPEPSPTASRATATAPARAGAPQPSQTVPARTAEGGLRSSGGGAGALALSGRPPQPAPPVRATAPVSPVARAAAGAAPDATVAGKAAPARQAAGPSSTQAGPAPVRPPAPQPGQPAMIPAGARFVHLGRFADADAAERAARKALALGYPVLRGRGQDGKPFLLAGPFDSRERIVRALNGLRQAGFRSAYPR